MSYSGVLTRYKMNRIREAGMDYRLLFLNIRTARGVCCSLFIIALNPYRNFTVRQRFAAYNITIHRYGVGTIKGGIIEKVWKSGRGWKIILSK